MWNFIMWAVGTSVKMKFSEHLGTHLTPEWRSQYVQYDVSTCFFQNICLGCCFLGAACWEHCKQAGDM